MINPYKENFSSWADVQKEYAMSEPEPKYVIFAYYTYEDYSGTACVLYWDDGKYYLDESGHCSCYGLEDTWEPISYDSAELFIKAVMDRTNYGPLKDFKDYILAAIKRNERRIK